MIAQIDPQNGSFEARTAGDGTRGNAGAAAQVQHFASRVDRHAIEIVGERLGKGGMAAARLEPVRDHFEHAGIERIRYAEGIDGF